MATHLKRKLVGEGMKTNDECGRVNKCVCMGAGGGLEDGVCWCV